MFKIEFNEGHKFWEAVKGPHLLAYIDCTFDGYWYVTRCAGWDHATSADEEAINQKACELAKEAEQKRKADNAKELNNA